MSFYNTTNLFGDILKDETKKAKTQKDAILAIYKKYGKPMTPEACQLRYSSTFGRAISINSVRRAISDLTAEGELEKTDLFGMGQWGKKVHKWRIAS